MINYLVLLAGALNLCLGFVVFGVRQRKPIHTAFFFMSIIFSIWMFLNFWFQLSANETVFRLIFSNSVLLPISLLAWVYFLVGEERFLDKFKIFFYPIILIGIVVIFSIWQGNLIVDHVFSTSEIILGDYFYGYAIYMIVSVTSFLYFLISVYFRSKIEEREKLKFVIIGFFSFLSLAVLFGVVLPLFGIDKLANFDSPSSILFFIFSSFAIMRYKLFNIEIVGTIFLTIILWLVLIVKAIIDRSDPNFSIDVLVLALSVILGITLIRSVLLEIKRRIKLQTLSSELNEANSKLKEVDALKTEFISMASHELLTPVSAIEGYLSMIFDEKLVKIEDPSAKKYLDSVYQSSKRLARLVADLLNVSRIEQGRLLTEKVDLDLGEVVEEVVAELKFKAEEKKQEIKINIEPDIGLITYADPDKIKEIVINLCGNSIKYIPDGGKIEVGIKRLPTELVIKNHDHMEEISAEKETAPDSSLQNAIDQNLRKIVGDNQLVIFVKDDGIGLSIDDISHLFKKFSRVGDFTTQETQGTGLGLYLSKALTEMQHGRIWAESEGRGKGSIFCIALPEQKCKNIIVELEGRVGIAKDAKPLAKSKNNY